MLFVTDKVAHVYELLCAIAKSHTFRRDVGRPCSGLINICTHTHTHIHTYIHNIHTVDYKSKFLSEILSGPDADSYKYVYIHV